jgi:hypothetical protein
MLNKNTMEAKLTTAATAATAARALKTGTSLNSVTAGGSVFSERKAGSGRLVLVKKTLLYIWSRRKIKYLIVIAAKIKNS